MLFRTLEELRNNVIKKILDMEGGYVNNKDDIGGETIYGITKTVALENGYTGDMKELPKQKAIEIYEKKYWDVLNLNEICMILDLDYINFIQKIFDVGVNQGIHKVALYLQIALNYLDGDTIECNGMIGKTTLEKFKEVMKNDDQDIIKTFLFRFINFKQAERYYSLGSQSKVFQYGWWKNRVSDFENYSGYSIYSKYENNIKFINKKIYFIKQNVSNEIENIYKIFDLDTELDLIKAFIKKDEKTHFSEFGHLNLVNRIFCFLIYDLYIKEYTKKEVYHYFIQNQVLNID